MHAERPLMRSQRFQHKGNLRSETSLYMNGHTQMHEVFDTSESCPHPTELSGTHYGAVSFCSSKRLQLHGEIVDPRLARRAILPQAGSVLTWFLL